MYPEDGVCCGTSHEAEIAYLETGFDGNEDIVQDYCFIRFQCAELSS